MHMKTTYAKKDRPVFIKTLLSYILAFTIPLLLICAFSYKLTIDTVKEKSNEIYITSLKSLINKFDTNFDSLNKFCVELSQVTWVKKLTNSRDDMSTLYMSDPTSFQYYIRELGAYSAMNEFIKYMAIYFNGKETILSTDGKYDTDSFFRDAFNFENVDAATWRKLLSEYNLSRILLPSNVKNYGSPYRYLTYIQSLPPGDRSFKSTVIIFIDEEVIHKLAKNTLNEEYSLYILDNNNEVITSFNADDSLFGVIKQNQYTSGDTIMIEDKKVPNKVNYRFFYSTSQVNNWKYIIAVPINNVLGKTYDLIYLNILVSLVSIIIGLLLSYKLTHYTYKPVYYLVEFVKKVFQEHTKRESDEYTFLQNAFHSMAEHNDKTESEIKVYKPLAKNAFLTKLLTGDINSHSAAILQDMLNISFVHKSFTCAHILLTSDHSFSEEIQSSILTELSLHSSFAFFVELDSKNKVLILNTPEEKKIIETSISIIENYLADIAIECKAIGVGKTYPDICDLYKSYSEATTSLDYKFVMSSNRVFYFENINIHNESTYYCPFEQEEFIINHVKSGNYSSAVKLIKTILAENLSKGNLPSYTVKHLCFHLASIVIKASEGIGVPVPPEIQVNIFKLDTVSTTEKYLEELCKQVCQTINHKKESGNSKLLKEILAYIDDRYKYSSLSLTSLSDQFGISPAYVSRFIKDQIGCNFITYLNKKRVEASKPLLLKNETIMQVALQVGFDNDLTFRRTFKKYEGITPGQYKNH